MQDCLDVTDLWCHAVHFSVVGDQELQVIHENPGSVFSAQKSVSWLNTVFATS